MNWLVIRILISHVANEGSSSFIPPFEVFARNHRQAQREIFHLWENKLNIFLGHISHTPILNPEKASGQPW